MVKPSRKWKSSLSDNHEHEFFKVYLSRLSSQQLVIPPAFVKHLNGNIPKDIMLKDCSGRQWHCRLEEAEGGLAITNGWKSFAIQHSLVTGDFLVFKYNRESLFTVNIFGRNGCIKEGTLFPNSDIIHVKKETETEEEHTFNTSDRACEQKYSENVLQRTKRSGSSSRATRFKPIKCDVTAVVERKTHKNGTYVVPKNPYFVSTIGSKYFVYVSGPVVRSHGIELKPEMTLLDEKGTKWPLKIAFGKDGRISITKGWINFYKKNNLKLGDKCAFEFVCTKGSICNEMKVQVIRAESNI